MIEALTVSIVYTFLGVSVLVIVSGLIRSILNK